MRTPTAFALLAVCSALAVAGCQPQQATLPEGEGDRRSMLTQLVDVTMMPLFERLEAQAAELDAAAVVLEGSAGADVAARTAARTAFATLQTTWQQLEVMHLGPAGSASFTGGQSLRDGIHSWPLVSPCGVDQQVVQNRMSEPGWASERLVNVVGLSALEYLLFSADDGNACPDAASINSEGTWAALGADVIASRRAVYVRVLADDLLAKSRALRGAWRDGFAEDLKTAGTGGSSFNSAQQALDEVYAALFFLELKTKDRKLGVPAGLHIECEKTVCPELTESPFARLSIEHVKHNLVGARLVFTGASDPAVDGDGFDDLLIRAGHEEAAADMVDKLDGAIGATTVFAGTIEEALASEPQRVIQLHAAVKNFTDELKSTLPSLLSLRVVAEGAGDND